MKQEFAQKRQRLLGYRGLRTKRTEHHPIGARIREMTDPESFVELDDELATRDPIQFPGYAEKLAAHRIHAEAEDACMLGIGAIEGISCVLAELSRYFLMGSMGTVAGEKLTRAFELADEKKLPLIIISASGGARMQEGMFSLLQMAKTSAAAQRFREHGGFYLSILTHPTTGGVSASYANLGDVILAEPGALIGFAGPRVIEQTIGEKLPAGFQRAEFQLEHGFVDRIVERKHLREEAAKLFRLHGYGSLLQGGDISLSEAVRDDEAMSYAQAEMQESGIQTKAQISDTQLREVAASKLTRKIEYADSEGQERLGIFTDAESAVCDTRRRQRTPYERVLLAREKDRPKIATYLDAIFEDFTELCGDRLGAEDPAILGGIARLGDRPVTVIGHRKGSNLSENLTCHFGMPQPEGYRKALRLMKEAERFGRPVITLIDTPGAYPGRAAEEHGQSIAIAQNLAEMSALKVPIITIVTGEGNSGGALAIGVGDRIWMLENAVYSVLSPEGFASILWKDSSRAREACEVMQMTSWELLEAGLVDGVIPEPEGGVQRDPSAVCGVLKQLLWEELQRLETIPVEELLRERYEKYRHIL